MMMMSNNLARPTGTEIELIGDDQGSNTLLRSLRLKFDTSLGVGTESVSSLANEAIFQGLAIRDGSSFSLSEMISFLLDLFNQLDINTNILRKLSLNATGAIPSSELKKQLLEFLVRKIEEFTKNLRLISQATEEKMISLISLLIRLIKSNFATKDLKQYYKDFVNLIKQTRNNKILNEILNLWNNTLVEVDIHDIRDALLPFLKKNLSNPDYRVRSKCLRILSFHYIHDEKLLKNKILKILLNFMEDQDPRVRIASLELMIILHINGIKIPVEYYDEIKLNLFDDFDQVRLLASQMISLLACSYPEHMIGISDNPEDDKIRLADDVFSKICFMINDISLEVKVCACSLLGKLELVSSRFLLQTLDKKLMSDLKVNKYQRNRQKQLVSSEWSTDVPTTSVDSVLTEGQNLNLIASGACGAFIHGLEDECLEVRAEAVDSLCSLAVKSPQFAAKSIDFLVDMFNDEIESVRLKAILSLTRILHYVLLGDDQVDIVVSVLEDSSFNVRESLKDLLSNCKLATKIGLKKAIQALFNNLKRYYSDRDSIWKCFQNLGKNHSKFVLSLVSFLVSLHPFLEITEPDINDIYYTSSLILLFNAVNQNSTLLPMLPRYVINHYFFLKLKIPDLIPQIKLIEDSANSVNNLVGFNPNSSVSAFQSIEQFFTKTKQNLKLVNSITKSNVNEKLYETVLTIFESINSDILYLSRIDSSFSVACDIMKQFMECYLTVKKLESKWFMKNKSDYYRLIQIEQALVTSIKLIVLYRGFNSREKLTLLKMYLYLRALYLREFYQRKASTFANQSINYYLNSYLRLNLSRKDLIKECHLYATLLKYFNRILDNKFKQTILGLVEQLPFEFNQYLNSKAFNQASNETDLSLDLLLLCDRPQAYQRESLVLVEPVDNMETPIRFTPGLISSIKVAAILTNFRRFDNLFIQVTYSDNDKQFIPVESSCIKALSSNKHILETSINLPNLALTDGCSVKICLTKLIDEFTDIKENLVGKHSESGVTASAESDENDESASNQIEETSRILSNLNERTQRACSSTGATGGNSTCSIEMSEFVKVYFEPLARKF